MPTLQKAFQQITPKRVKQYTSFENRIRQIIIFLMILWLFVTVVMPVYEVLERSLYTEVFVTVNNDKDVLVGGRHVSVRDNEFFVDDTPVALIDGNASHDGVSIQVEEDTLRKVVVRKVIVRVTPVQVRDITVVIEPGRVMVDGETLPQDDLRAEVRRWIGAANYRKYFTNPALYYSIYNSLFVSFLTTFIAVTLAFIYAYALNRTMMPGKIFFRIVAMLPLYAPTMLYGLSLVYLFGNKGLITTGMFGKAAWLAYDIGLYGPVGIIIAEIAFTFPAAYLVLLVAFSSTDARLYEAAQSLKASALRIFWTVTLPGVRFGLISAIFVCFTLCFTDFGAPKVVGGNYNVLAVDIYKQVIGQQNFGMGATISIILLIPAVISFLADRLAQRHQVVAMTARSVPFIPKKHRGMDITMLLICSLIAGFILLMLFTAGFASFVKLWPYDLMLASFEITDEAVTKLEQEGMPSTLLNRLKELQGKPYRRQERFVGVLRENLGEKTVAQYQEKVLRHTYIFPFGFQHYNFEAMGGGGYAAFRNSVRMAAYTAVLGTLIAFVSAYLMEKTRGMKFLRQAAYLLSIIPLALPGLVIGIAYIFFFNKPVFLIPLFGIEIPNPLNALYGTMGILIIANIIHFYTVSVLTATTALRQLDKEFETVSESMSVPFYTTFRRVTVPVCLPAILEIAVYYFVSSMATVSAVIFLYTADTKLASVAVVNMDDAGDTSSAAAMCMLIVITNILVRLSFEGISVFLKKRSQAWRMN